MNSAIYGCPEVWTHLLPPGTCRDPREIRLWPLLAWTGLVRKPEGLRCRILLAPGDGSLEGIRAETVVTCGLSPRDSLTLSSLWRPVLCVQRSLPRPDGGTIEPQEFPLPPLPAPPELLLPLLGLRLLQMPLTEGRFP